MLKGKKAIILVGVVMVMLCVCCLGACMKRNLTATPAYDEEKQGKAENYTAANQTAAHGQIVLIGDSIVELLPEEKFSNALPYTVFNRGISGDTSDRMLERLQENALNIAPKGICILVGTNDISYRLTEEKSLEYIGKAIAAAKQSGARVWIQSLYPVNKSVNRKMVGRRNNDDICSMNEKLKALALETGSTYIDVYSALKDEKGNFRKEYTYDGLHPNAEGYGVIIPILEENFLSLIA